MFLHDKFHRGTTSSQIPDNPHIIWERNLSPNGFYSSTTIHNGVVFVGGVDRTMYALDAETGDTVWTFETGYVQNGQGIDGSAAVSGGNVYFGSDDFKFYAVSESTGDLEWSYEVATTGFNPQTYGVQASPVVVGGVVYTGADMSQGDNVNLVDNLIALDSDTGDLIWSFDTNGRVYSSPAIDGDTLFVATFQGSFYSIDITSGGQIFPPNTRWSKDYEHGFMGSPMLHNKRVYIGEGQYQEPKGTYRLLAYTYSGAEIWSYDVEYPIISTPIPYDGNLFFADYGGTVHVVKEEGNGGTTDLVWKHHLSNREIWSSTLVTDGKVLIGSTDGKLYCLDIVGNGDGTTYEHWNLTLDGEVWGSPVAVDGKVYITTMRGTVYCIGEDPAPPVKKEPVLEQVEVQPFQATAGKEITIMATFEDGGDLSQVKEICVDLSALGGNEKSCLNDEGVDGDEIPDDGKFSLKFGLPGALQEGYYDLHFDILLLNGKKITEMTTFFIKKKSDNGSGIPGAGILLLFAAFVIATRSNKKS
jgi:outer membrane protein assembly factor BamB